ncbi:MAG: LytTR family transcriptional regulator [Bryobacterales bacterium]|nr:LytTR family transcriptional regulator [Bryobacterales bacterium]
MAEIDSVEAAGNYVCFHVRGESHILRGKFGDVGARLDPERFVRIHRSAIGNARIQELRPGSRRSSSLILSLLRIPTRCPIRWSRRRFHQAPRHPEGWNLHSRGVSRTAAREE